MSTVQQAIEVSAPLHTVYEQFASFDSYPQFMTGMQEITPVTGTTAHMVMDLNGQPCEFDAEMTECRLDERVAWHAADGPMVSEVIMLRQIDSTHTRIIAQLEADVQGLMPGDAQAKEMLDRRLKADLAGFKRYIEQDLNAATPAAVARRGKTPKVGLAATAGTPGERLTEGGDAAMGTAYVGAPGTGKASRNPRASAARAGNARGDELAVDLDMDARRLTGTGDIGEDRGGADR